MSSGNTSPLWDNTGDSSSGWGAQEGSANPVKKMNAFFYKKLQYSGSVNQAKRNKHQPLPQSRDILRQKGIDMQAPVDVLQEHLITREEL